MMKKKTLPVSRKRANKNIITYSGEIHACERRNNGWYHAVNISSANLRITATVEEWEKFRKIVDREESLLTWSFGNVLDRVYNAMQKNDPRIPSHAVMEQRASYMLAAMLYLFFEFKKAREPLKKTIKLMRLLYPEKKNVITTSLEDGRGTDASIRFRIGYVNRGKKILEKISDKNDDGLSCFDMLMRRIENRIRVVESKIEKADLIFIFNLVAASFVFFDRHTDYRWLSHPSLLCGYPSEYADSRFNAIRQEAKQIYRDVTSWIK